MGTAATRPRHNRTITVDFHDEATYVQLLNDGKAFVAWVLAFILALGFQLRHQTNLSRRRVPNPPLPLHPRPPRWGHYLASPMYEVQSRVHGPPALRIALSPDAPGGRARRPAGHPRGPQFGAVRGDLPSLPHGPLPPGLCVWPPEFGHRADPVRAAAAGLFPGR